MAIVASYDWESDTFTHHDHPARPAWREAVAEGTEKAKAAPPGGQGGPAGVQWQGGESGSDGARW